jgi:ADP-ribose pyrophosphatase YjhB (NUDIX family)
MQNLSKYSLIEVKEKDGVQIKYIWHPGVIPDDIPIQQVYGFCVSKDNLVCLVRDKEEQRFTPVGGGVEKGETALVGLQREFNEEAQFFPSNPKLLGSLEVINPGATEEIQKHNLQVRYVCEIDDIDKFIPGKDGFETEERIFVYYKDLPKYVGFIDKYTSGRIQFEMLCDYIEGKINL